MKQENVLDILKRANAIITNSHFVYTSDRHGDVYINKDALYPHVEEASKVAQLFAEKFKDLDMDAVVAPALGGILLSQWTAFHLSKIKKKKILGIYTEKNLEKDQIFTRGYDKLVRGKKVVVVEDVATTGGSIKKVIVSVKEHGAKVLAVGVMVNRDPENVNEKTMGAPLFSLANLFVKSYDEKECPLCRANISVNTDVGHGRKFLEKSKV